MEELFKNLPFVFGLLAAIIHVLSGPDHLAAVGPLAFNTNLRSWVVGVAWGIGHVTGMLIIGLLFLFFKELIPVDFISENSERLVGIMLIAIGVWALIRLYYRTRKTGHVHFHKHETEEGDVMIHKHEHSHHKPFEKHSHRDFERQTAKTALGIGTIHGLAGVSHILAILPTLAFSTVTGSVLYLAGFAIGTIVAMVLFSLLMGYIAAVSHNKKSPAVFLLLNGLTGSAAILVGVVWIWQTW